MQAAASEYAAAACAALSDTMTLTTKGVPDFSWARPCDSATTTNPFAGYFDTAKPEVAASPRRLRSRSHGMQAAQARIVRERWWSSVLLAAFVAGIALMLSSPIAFFAYLRRESVIAHWHYGKLVILWGLDLLLFVGFYAANGSRELDVALLVSAPTTLALAAVTWKWLSGRERVAVS
jgi:hypothetical protein